VGAGSSNALHSMLHADPPPLPSAFAGSCLLVRAPQAAIRTALSPSSDAHGSVQVHGGLSMETEFETDLFQGRMRVVFRVPPEEQAEAAAALLEGKKRQMWVMIQVCALGVL